MTPQRKKIITAFPELAQQFHQQETNDLLKQILQKKNDEITVKGVGYLKGDKGDKPIKGVDYLTDGEIDDIKTEVTPVKGLDYFTDDEIDQIQEEITPVKGVDYFDGEDGEDGEDGQDIDPDEVASIVMGKIKLPEVDEDTLIQKVLAQIPEVNVPTVKDLVNELKKKQYLEPKDIKGMPINMNDMRWHGGGGKANNVTATLPITSSGGVNPDISTSLATNKLVGRGSAGTGVFEAITLGTNLSLTGTTLNASGGGAVSSVSNLDGSITISPTTGAVVVSLNPAHANTWGGFQNFSGGLNALSIGVNTLNISGNFMSDSGAISSDGTGDLSVSILSATTVQAGSLIISGTSSLDSGLITTDGSGNLVVQSLQTAGGLAVGSDLVANGIVQALSGFVSADGTSGTTGTQGIGQRCVVKNGLVVGFV